MPEKMPDKPRPWTSSRPQVTNSVIESMFAMVRAHMFDRFERTGRGVFVSSYEAIGAITEQYHELVEAERHSDRRQMAAALADTAVTCVIALASFSSIDDIHKEAKGGQDAPESENAG